MTPPSHSGFAGEKFARAWEGTHPELLVWLKSKRFTARPDAVEAVFQAAEAAIRADDWRACRAGAGSDSTMSASAVRLLQSAFVRAVRVIEIRKWSELILGSDSLRLGADHIPSGPLALPETWRSRLAAPWNDGAAAISSIVEAALGELASAGWAALGGYGLHADPGQHFLALLHRHLQVHGTWEGVLNSAYVADGLPLLRVLENQACKEFNDPADGNRAFHWAVDHLVKERFTGSGVRPVHEVANPIGYLKTAFARALVDFRRVAWRPHQIQRPRPDAWIIRTLSQDWIDIFRLSVRHAGTASVAHRFLMGERASRDEDDSTDDSGRALNASGHAAPRMTDAQRRFEARAQQIELEHGDDPTTRARAMATWCRAYLEQVKQWQPVGSDLPLYLTDNEGGESERPLPPDKREPLAELICEEERRRLLGATAQTDRNVRAGTSIEDRLRGLVHTLLGAEFGLTDDDIAVLRRIADPPPPTRGRPPKDAAKEHLLVRLRQAAAEAGLDTSIFDSLSVIFPEWNNNTPPDPHAKGTAPDCDRPESGAAP